MASVNRRSFFGLVFAQYKLEKATLLAGPENADPATSEEQLRCNLRHTLTELSKFLEANEVEFAHVDLAVGDTYEDVSVCDHYLVMDNAMRVSWCLYVAELMLT
eukprot:COSAG05_NODE_75_length_21588_cov_303.091438_17_plen_104_part_00